VVTDEEHLVLTNAALALTEQVSALNKEATATLGNLTTNVRKTKRIMKALFVSLIVDVCLTLLGGVLVIRQNDTINNVQALTDRINTAQSTTRKDNFCPLYQAFLDAREFAPVPTDPAAVAFQEKVYAKFQERYDAIGCVPPK
jgi:hypothetical protein